MKALTFAAALLATTVPLGATEPPGHLRAASSWRLDTEAFWTWTRLWLGLPGEPAVPELRKSACEGGLSIDPDGRTVCRSQASPNRDAGGSIDPDG